MPARIHVRHADDGPDDRDLRDGDARTSGPGRRLRLQHRVEFAALDRTFEHQPTGRVVLAKARLSCLKDEVEPATGDRHGQAGVEGQAQLRVAVVSSRPQGPHAAQRAPADVVFADERAGVRLIEQHRPLRRQAHRADAVEHEAVELHAGFRSARERERRHAAAIGREQLNALGGTRGVGDGKLPLAQVEPERSQHPACLVADGHQGCHLRHRRVNPRHGVSAAVDHEVLPVEGLLKRRRFAETSHKVGWKAGDGLQRLDLA